MCSCAVTSLSSARLQAAAIPPPPPPPRVLPRAPSPGQLRGGGGVPLPRGGLKSVCPPPPKLSPLLLAELLPQVGKMLVKAACSPGQAFSNQQRIPQPLPRPPAPLLPVPSGQQQGILGARPLRLLQPPASHRFFPGNEMLQRDFWLQELQGAASLAGEGRATRDQESGAKKGLPTRQRRKLSRCRKTPSAASWPGPGLPQCHSVQPGEGAGESRAADSIWRAKSMCWRSSWTNDCLDEEPASTRSPPGPSKVPAHLDVTQRGHGWWQGPCEPFLSRPSPCRDGLELAPTPGMQSQGSRRDAQGLL
ncbi:LOW QUALITY PROTEIN: cell cycle and apoptosis regulator protein 2 [Morphnus guianensis]